MTAIETGTVLNLSSRSRRQLSQSRICECQQIHLRLIAKILHPGDAKKWPTSGIIQQLLYFRT